MTDRIQEVDEDGKGTVGWGLATIKRYRDEVTELNITQSELTDMIHEVRKGNLIYKVE